MKPDSISVVIPAFNAARFISDALESVLAQSVRTDEVLVVDDGSVDQTREVAGRFRGVQVLTTAHAGVSHARNHGVRCSSGSWIAFLDADDTWHPDKLKKQLAVASIAPETGVVMARQTYRFDCPVPAWFRGRQDGGSEPGFQPSNWLVRRATWEMVGQFDESRTHSEDTDWLARARDLGVVVRAADFPLVVHRIHDANASGMPAAVRSGVLSALRDSVQRKRETTNG